MKLSEIIDIEFQLYKDSQSDPAAIRRRDRNIGQEYRGQEKARVSIFLYWLNKVKNKNSYPGSYISYALTFLRYVLFFLFLISGATTCAAVLAYDGTSPVNIVNFLAVFAGLQVLLYFLFFINILPAGFRKKIPLIGDFYRFTGFIFKFVLEKAGTGLYKNRTESIRQLSSILYRARSRHTIYQKMERWTIFSLTQLGGFAFSLGALASCAYLITFSDLAFAWNTTLDISPEFFHRIIKSFSLPWAAFFKDMVPTLDLVEATRYFRLNGDYAGTGSSALTAGGWWPFLICTLITYSLIPRFIFMCISRIMLLHMHKKSIYLSSEFDSLHRRLTSPLFTTRSENNTGEENMHEHALISMPGEKSLCENSAHLIMWGEMDLSEPELTSIIESALNINITDIHFAGMLDNTRDENTLKGFEENSDDEPVMLLAESWEAPGRAVEHFLKRLRSVINKDRKIIIALISLDPENEVISPSKADWQNWQDLTLKLNDPFMSIEPVTGKE